MMSYNELKRIILDKLVSKLDLSKVSDLESDTLRREIRLVVERLYDTENPRLGRMERERLIEEVLDEVFGTRSRIKPSSNYGQLPPKTEN